MRANNENPHPEPGPVGHQPRDPRALSRRDVLKVGAAASAIPLASAFRPNAEAVSG